MSQYSDESLRFFFHFCELLCVDMDFFFLKDREKNRLIFCSNNVAIAALGLSLSSTIELSGPCQWLLYYNQFTNYFKFSLGMCSLMFEEM